MLQVHVHIIFLFLYTLQRAYQLHDFLIEMLKNSRLSENLVLKTYPQYNCLQAIYDCL